MTTNANGAHYAVADLTSAEPFTVAYASQHNAKKWHNRKTTWAEMLEKLSECRRTPETFAEFQAASRTRKTAIKDVGGFVGGYLKGGLRKRETIEYRTLICLDVDFGSWSTWDRFCEAFPGIEAFAYTTHSHSEKTPKFRLVVPLARQTKPDEYIAVTRKIAERVGIEDFDKTTFEPERLMFWPSASRDGEFETRHQQGAMLQPDAVLELYDDWTDTSTWPTSKREGDVIGRAIKKQENPLEKTGIVGAWCRVFSVEDVIDKYLQDVYEAGENGRYTLKGGSSANGLVIYENGLFAYSHHGTDKAGSQLCNAFDLVRIHEYSERDDDAKPDTPPHKLPSFLALAEFAQKLPEIRAELGRMQAESAADEFAEYAESDDAPTEAEQIGDVFKRLKCDKKGNPLETIDNLVRIMRHDPVLKDSFIYNEFKDAVEITRPVPWRDEWNAGDRVTDGDLSQIKKYVERVYGLHSPSRMLDAFNIIFSKKYHPVRDYLTGLAWDGTPRIDAFFILFFGVADTPYARAVSRKMFLGAVARILQPGVKFDWVLTLVGAQGIGKSTAFRKLGHSWFSDTFFSIEGTKGYEACVGNWIIEIGEMSGLSRSDAEKQKAFISSSCDIYRKSYARMVSENPRQCIFIATTNQPNFLKGEQGDRRFWPLTCYATEPALSVFEDLDEQLVGQLWSEAVAAYQAGEKLYLDRELERQANEVQKHHAETDDRESLIEKYLNTKLPENWSGMDLYARREFLSGFNDFGPVEPGTVVRTVVCCLEIWCECFKRQESDLKTPESKAIGRLLRRLGWELQPLNATVPPYGRPRVFARR